MTKLEALIEEARQLPVSERRRLSRELHDETAQVFSAVKMELGVLREGITPAEAPRLDQILALIDAGIRTIRNVTNDLRPSLLDDLGLLPALRSLAAEFAERSGVEATFSAPPALPGLFMVGLVQPIGPTIPLVEIQARWIASVLAGETALPDAAVMQAEIAAHNAQLARRYVGSARYTLEVDFGEYARQLRRDMAARKGGS